MTTSNVVDIYATSEPFEQWLECTLSEINHKLGDLIYKEQVNQLWNREMESTVRNIRVSVCSQRVTVSVSCQTDEQLAQAYDSSPRCSEAKEDAIESVNPSFSVVENDSSPSVVADTHMEEHSESYTSSRSESAESYQCIHCEATFSRKDEFSKHQQSHGKYIKEPQMCQFCLQVFKNQKALSRHTNLRTCQGKDKSNYDCSTCGKSFDTLGKLTYHRLHHREKKCLCTLCGKAFHHPVQLNRHMRVHTGEKPYSCTVCSKRFSTEYNCRHHIRVRHVE